MDRLPNRPKQKVIIPKGTVRQNETAIIEIPQEFQNQPVVVVRPKPLGSVRSCPGPKSQQGVDMGLMHSQTLCNTSQGDLMSESQLHNQHNEIKCSSSCNNPTYANVLNQTYPPKSYRKITKTIIKTSPIADACLDSSCSTSLPNKTPSRIYKKVVTTTVTEGPDGQIKTTTTTTRNKELANIMLPKKIENPTLQQTTKSGLNTSKLQEKTNDKQKDKSGNEEKFFDSLETDVENISNKEKTERFLDNLEDSKKDERFIDNLEPSKSNQNKSEPKEEERFVDSSETSKGSQKKQESEEEERFIDSLETSSSNQNNEKSKEEKKFSDSLENDIQIITNEKDEEKVLGTIAPTEANTKLSKDFQPTVSSTPRINEDKDSLKESKKPTTTAEGKKKKTCNDPDCSISPCEASLTKPEIKSFKRVTRKTTTTTRAGPLDSLFTSTSTVNQPQAPSDKARQIGSGFTPYNEGPYKNVDTNSREPTNTFRGPYSGMRYPRQPNSGWVEVPTIIITEPADSSPSQLLQSCFGQCPNSINPSFEMMHPGQANSGWTEITKTNLIGLQQPNQNYEMKYSGPSSYEHLTGTMYSLNGNCESCEIKHSNLGTMKGYQSSYISNKSVGTKSTQTSASNDDGKNEEVQKSTITNLDNNQTQPNRIHCNLCGHGCHKGGAQPNQMNNSHCAHGKYGMGMSCALQENIRLDGNAKQNVTDSFSRCSKPSYRKIIKTTRLTKKSNENDTPATESSQLEDTHGPNINSSYISTSSSKHPGYRKVVTTTTITKKPMDDSNLKSQNQIRNLPEYNYSRMKYPYMSNSLSENALLLDSSYQETPSAFYNTYPGNYPIAQQPMKATCGFGISPPAQSGAYRHIDLINSSQLQHSHQPRNPVRNFRHFDQRANSSLRQPPGMYMSTPLNYSYSRPRRTQPVQEAPNLPQVVQQQLTSNEIAEQINLQNYLEQYEQTRRNLVSHTNRIVNSEQ